MRRPEDERVKIPALLHFTRLGYQYISLKANHSYNPDTNIFTDTLHSAINRVNGIHLTADEMLSIVTDLKISLQADDLGKAFYQYLLHGYQGNRLIDFEKIENNTFQVVTELPCINGVDEFRPDITVLINGLPLAMIEVKRPNNKNGIQAEYSRMNSRCRNKKFRRFINITQIMIFSNNSEYDDNEPVPLEGAFYAASDYKKLFFSHFREEDQGIHLNIPPALPSVEDFILRDTNLTAIKGFPDYVTNTDPLTPTNRIITSLFRRERLIWLLRYAFAYVERTDENGIKTLEKHIMRYPQIFAIKAIQERLSTGEKKGIIWHTQGSGKTALAFFCVRFLRDYYHHQGQVAKFYFIVDRLDLLVQAADEFRARGLQVDEVDSREAFVENIRMTGVGNASGQDTITVVNIQRFSEEAVTRPSDYSVNVQRVYFLDEAHRGYRPTGSFLANLISSDRNAVKIALTGTPLIGHDYDTKDVFGAYIHKYYYNNSIIDRYTLRLLREGIKTEYRVRLQEVLESIETQRGTIDRKALYAHPQYVKDLVKYIVEDFQKSRLALGDNTIGGMIVCDSSEQAREVCTQLEGSGVSSALILHDEEDRFRNREAFKKGTVDILVVFNMLLTGFNAPRLKKMYLGRVIRDHSLLQALTRVNRPYNKHRFGYVVDFADIRNEFDKTNRAYLAELHAELGTDFGQYSSIFMTSEEIQESLQQIKEVLFLYDTDNISRFIQQISALESKEDLLKLHAALERYKELYNIARLFEYETLADAFTLENARALASEAANRIAMLNLKQSLQNAEDMTSILNLALEEIEFRFKKVSESELVIADAFRQAMEKTQHEMKRGLDPQDPQYITLMEELKRLLSRKNIEELTADEMQDNIIELERIRKKAEELILKDSMLAAKYENDPKFMRIHKRLKATPPPLGTDTQIFSFLLAVKHTADDKLLSNHDLLRNEHFFKHDMLRPIKTALESQHLPFAIQQVQEVSRLLTDEYSRERKWVN